MEAAKQERNKTTGADIPQWYLEIEPRLLQYIGELKELEEKVKSVKATIKTLMEDDGIDTIDSGLAQISMRKPYDSETIDKDRLKEELPDVYKEYVKTKHCQGYIAVKLNEKQPGHGTIIN